MSTYYLSRHNENSQNQEVLLEGLYILAKILVLYVQRLYYKDPIVINSVFTKIDKPTILVTNHPNTLLDAVFGAATVSSQAKFLANYSLFKSRIGNWFFNTFYCIPVQRPEDIGGEQIDNGAAIAKSHSFLVKGGTLYIAAEGYSIQTIGIRPLKTGAARIALGAENDMNWNADVQILPIGLNYDQADRFRSNLVIHVGKPFTVKNKARSYFEDPKSTVQQLTSELTEEMKSVLLDADDIRTSVLQNVRVYLAQMRPTDPKREYLRTRKLLVDLKALDDRSLARLAKEINQFENTVSKANTSGKAVAAALYDQKQPISLLHLVSSLPITIIGFLTNVIPYILCHLIERKSNKLLVYRATFRILPALILFPLMYLFWMWLISYFTNNVILTLGSIVIYRRSGIFAWHQIKKWSRRLKSKRINRENPQHIDYLSKIIASIDGIQS